MRSGSTPPEGFRNHPADPQQQNLQAQERKRLLEAVVQHPYRNLFLLLWAAVPAIISSVWLFANAGLTLLIPPAILFVFAAMTVECILVWMFTFGILASLAQIRSPGTDYEAWFSGAFYFMLSGGTLAGWIIGILVQVARAVFHL